MLEMHSTIREAWLRQQPSVLFWLVWTLQLSGTH